MAMGSSIGRTAASIAVIMKEARGRATASSTMGKARASAKAYGAEESSKERVSTKSHGGLPTGWFGTREKLKQFVDSFRVINVNCIMYVGIGPYEL